MPTHYLDPSRPRISGLPAFAPGDSRLGMSIIPGLHIAPRGTPDSNLIEISGFFSTGRNASSRREITIPATDFAAFWQRWLADPEGVAEREFKWSPSAQPAAPERKAPLLTADDLLEDLL